MREYICHVPLPPAPPLRIQRLTEVGLETVVIVGDAGPKRLYEGLDPEQADKIYDLWVSHYEERRQAEA